MSPYTTALTACRTGGRRSNSGSTESTSKGSPRLSHAAHKPAPEG